MLEKELIETINNRLITTKETLEYQSQALCEAMSNVEVIQYLFFLLTKKD